jgi:hypothetical protein
MHQAILDVAVQYSVPLVDAEALIAERAEDGVLGSEWLLDHVHPSILGHQLIAEALYEVMENMKLVRRPQGWREARDELWQHYLSSLNRAYYAHGIERLERLNKWSRRRAPDPPPAPSGLAED